MTHLAHELMAPLGAALGLANLLSLDGERLSDPQRRRVRQIEESIQHSIGIVAALRASTEAVAAKRSMHDVDVNDVVADVCAWLEVFARQQGVALRPQALATARVADGQALRQVLINLVTNAIKYNRHGGEVRIGEGLDGRGGWIAIEVEDTGRGIAPESLDRIFEPYERLDAGRLGLNGQGLGLSIARRLATDRLHGQLQVTSALGEGSVFTLQLPASR